MKLLLLILTVTALVGCNSKKDSVNRDYTQEAQEIAPNREVEAAKPDLRGLVKLLGTASFTLEDGEAIHNEFPDTFEVPDLNLRSNLKRDDLVKLMFTMTDGTKSQTERMWVIVTGGDATGYTGILDNDPYCTDSISSGLEVTFLPKNVISIY